MPDTASFTRCPMQPGTVQYDACHAAMVARIAALETTLRRLRAELAALHRLDGHRRDVQTAAGRVERPTAAPAPDAS